MHLVKSYKVKIINRNKIFKQTIQAYSNAVWFIVDVINNNYSSLEDLTSKQKYNFIEKLIHNTKENKAKYDFDDKFINFPSYFRRSAIAIALGKYESWYSNYKNWEINKVGNAPKLSKGYLVMPCFFKNNMFLKTNDKYIVRIKVLINKCWDYIDIPLRKTDIDYIEKNCFSLKESNPTLIKKDKNYYLNFAYDINVDNLPKGKVEKMCAVDLGINNVATCSILTSDGTVLARKFIKCIREEDQINHYLNKIKKHQRLGSKENKTLWAKVNNFNREISIKASNEIINFAKTNEVKVIVFEYLDTKGKKKGSKKQRLALWRKRDIQKRVTLNAHIQGIRVNRICAFNTSRLAFDGSGKVLRGKEIDPSNTNYSICKFTNGKIYNCDLNASYNIGARYYIKELEKTTSEKKWLLMVAKVPSLSKRSTCTLSTLKEILA